jgi:nucleoside-triphosphatase
LHRDPAPTRQVGSARWFIHGGLIGPGNWECASSFGILTYLAFLSILSIERKFFSVELDFDRKEVSKRRLSQRSEVCIKQMNLRKKNLLIMGHPGVGKTTLIVKLAEALRDFHPAGFYTKEIREEGLRKGFELVSLEGRRGLLSHIDIKSSNKVGKYKVNIEGFEDFLESIPFFKPKTHFIILDEIGKMECLSDEFKGLLREILDSEKWMIGTIAFEGSGLIAEVKERGDVKIFEITEKNRDYLLLEILRELGIGS